MTSETAMPSGRTNATITVAAQTRYPAEALAGHVCTRDGERRAEVGREDLAAGGNDRAGASAHDGGWPPAPLPATDPGAGSTVLLWLTDEPVMSARSTIGCC